MYNVNKNAVEVYIKNLMVVGKASKSRSWVMSDIVKNVQDKFGYDSSVYAREFIISNYLVNK